jgi:hypothetical protein
VWVPEGVPVRRRPASPPQRGRIARLSL